MLRNKSYSALISTGAETSLFLYSHNSLYFFLSYNIWKPSTMFVYMCESNAQLMIIGDFNYREYHNK